MEMPKPRAPTFRGLRLPARIYIVGVLGFAVAAVATATGAADGAHLEPGQRSQP